MTAVLIVAIVLIAIGAIMLLAGVLYPNKGGPGGVGPEALGPWDIIDAIVKFLIDLFKSLLGEASIRQKVLILGSIFFIVGVGLIFFYASKS